MKRVRTPFYNYDFDEKTGYFARWGKDIADDPTYSPIGLEILDIEVSTVCHQGCAFCYKSNAGVGNNMSLKEFKEIIDKLPTVTQVAFGIGDIDGNPDLFNMFAYCREKEIVPNVTINGNRLTQEHILNLVKYCGAVAVSNYDYDTCANTVHALTSAGLGQVNIHQLLSEETFQNTLDLINKYSTGDKRLSNLNAIVFLSLKKKGRGEYNTTLSTQRFKSLIDTCFNYNIPFGFDSCTACKFTKQIKSRPDYDTIIQSVEPCESGLFSGYINVKGMFSPCSFSEGITEAEYDMAFVTDFLPDVWYGVSMIDWRENLLRNGRNCPIYKV